LNYLSTKSPILNYAPINIHRKTNQNLINSFVERKNILTRNEDEKIGIHMQREIKECNLSKP